MNKFTSLKFAFALIFALFSWLASSTPVNLVQLDTVESIPLIIVQLQPSSNNNNNNSTSNTPQKNILINALNNLTIINGTTVTYAPKTQTAPILPQFNPKKKIEKDRSNRPSMRRVIGAIPIDSTFQNVLLISSRRKPGVWIFPKGGLESHESEAECAQRESFEEAGIYGVASEKLLTRISNDARTHFTFYNLIVQRVEEEWPEMEERDRMWVPIDKVLDYVKREIMVDAFKELVSRLKK